MFIRRMAVVLAAGLVAALCAGTTGASAAPAGGVCQLHGVANLTPGLGAPPGGAFTYTFSGSLGKSQTGGCQSNVTGAPTAGDIEAGLTKQFTVQLTKTSDGSKANLPVSYAEPKPSGSGSCAQSTTSGVAVVTWASGKHTVVSYDTNGAAAGVGLTGDVVQKVDLALVASSVPAGYTGAPATQSISTDEPSFPVGNQAAGPLAFTPTTQSQNCATVPVTSANIDGLVAIGTPS
ncbi:MAG: hypothetical protein ABR600_13195 [Actinomycetota bacterium]